MYVCCLQRPFVYTCSGRIPVLTIMSLASLCMVKCVSAHAGTVICSKTLSNSMFLSVHIELI